MQLELLQLELELEFLLLESLELEFLLLELLELVVRRSYF